MPYYAQLSDTDQVVCLSQLSDTVDAAHMIEVTQDIYDAQAIVGGTYNRKTKKFTAPKPPEPLPESRDIHPVALYERFTFAERVGITRAGQINATDTPEKQTLAATVSRFERDLAVYQRPISLDGEGLAKGLALLASLQVLDADWQERIVKAPITEAERGYNGRR
jgi:hypothetical protein